MWEPQLAALGEHEVVDAEPLRPRRQLDQRLGGADPRRGRRRLRGRRSLDGRLRRARDGAPGAGADPRASAGRLSRDRRSARAPGGARRDDPRHPGRGHQGLEPRVLAARPAGPPDRRARARHSRRSATARTRPDVVASFAGPLVVVVGDQDDILPVDEARQIAESAPNGRSRSSKAQATSSTSSAGPVQPDPARVPAVGGLTGTPFFASRSRSISAFVGACATSRPPTRLRLLLLNST